MLKQTLLDIFNVVSAIGLPEQQRALDIALGRNDEQEVYRIYERTLTRLETLPDPIVAKILYLTSIDVLRILNKNERLHEIIDAYQLIERRLHRNQKLYGFGLTYHGSLGDNDPTTHLVANPQLIEIGDLNIKQACAANYHSIVLTTNGKIYGFGDGEYGKLGDGDTTFHEVPMPMLIPMGNQFVTQISSVSLHTMAVTREGQLYGWGSGENGRLGDGDITRHFVSRPMLIDVDGKRVKQVATGRDFTMVVTTDGQLYGCGDGGNGALGDGNLEDHDVGTFTLINVNNQRVKSVTCGGETTLVITEKGELYGFGHAENGKLGDGNLDDHSIGIPTRINIHNQKIKHVFDGFTCILVITDNGKLYGMGNGRYGIFGDGDTTNHNYLVPTLININGEVIKEASLGNRITRVVTENGNVYGFGTGFDSVQYNIQNVYYYSPYPTLIDFGGHKVKHVSTYMSHTLAITSPTDYDDLNVYDLQIAAQISDCQHCQTQMTYQQCTECDMVLCDQCFDKLH